MMEKAHKEQLISSFHLKLKNSYYAQKGPIFRRFDHQYIELEKKYKDIQIRLYKTENY